MGDIDVGGEPRDKVLRFSLFRRDNFYNYD